MRHFRVPTAHLMIFLLLFSHPTAIYAQQSRTIRVPEGAQVEPNLPAQAETALVRAGGASLENELKRVVAVPLVGEQEEVVDYRSGRFIYEEVDMVVPAGAISLEVVRSLQLESGEAGLLGTRWRLNWEKRVLVGADVAVLDEGAGQRLFRAVGDGEIFRSIDGQKLVFSPQHAVCTKPDGTREYFGPDGRLIAVDGRNGNKHVLKYDAEGLLTRVEGPFRTFLRFYRNAQGRVVRIEGSNGATVHYTYGEDAEASSTDDGDLSVGYAYDDVGRLAKIDHFRTGTTEIAYDTRNRVISRTWADGAQEKFTYDDEAGQQTQVAPAGHETTTYLKNDGSAAAIRNALGYMTTVEYDSDGRTTHITGPTGKHLSIQYDRIGRIARLIDSVKGPTEFQYQGESGKLSAQISADGSTNVFHYDANQNVSAVATTPQGPQQARMEYFPNGLIKTITSASGRRVMFGYDQNGQISQITDPNQAVIRMEYDRQGNLIREIDPLGRVTRRTYNEHGWLTSHTDPLGATTRLEYGPSGLPAKMIDPRGAETRFEYDERGRLVAQIDAAGKTLRWKYGVDGRMASVTGSGGTSYTYKYDAMGNLIGEINAVGGGVARFYDPIGNLVAEVNSIGARTHFEYSATGNVIESVDPVGTIARYGYDARGNLTRLIDATGQVTSYAFDDRGRLGMIVPPIGPVVRVEYDEDDNVLAVKQDDHVVVRYAYDAAGRRVREEHATGYSISYRYDAAGNLIAWSDNIGKGASIEYDLADRPTKITDVAGAARQIRYDAVGNVVAKVDPLGNETRLAYSAVNELTEVVAEAGRLARYVYDEAGRLQKIVHPGGGETSYAYDPMGNPTRTTDTLGNSVSMTYDVMGRLVSRTDAKGQTTKFFYDLANRLVRKELADGKVVKYEYDAQGNQTLVDDGVFPIKSSYDSRGNRVKVEYPAIQRSLSYTFDDAGNITRFVNSEGQTIHYTHDAHNRLTEIHVPGRGAFQFAYDAADRVTSLTYPNGVRCVAEYDHEDQPLKLAYLDADLDVIAGWKHVYDAAGNCTQTTDAKGESVEFRYDAAGQLLAESDLNGNTINYRYGPGGNRLSRTEGASTVDHQYDKADRLVRAGDDQFRYDKNGNLVEKRRPGGVTRYQYDAEDRLVQVTLPDGSHVQYGYAPTGERIWRRDARGQTYYVTDGLHVLAELDENLQSRDSYVYGPGIDRPLSMTRGEETFYFHADRLGSVSYLTDPQAKTVATYKYDAFGRVIAREGDLECLVTYTARRFDEATGLYYYRARYYDPSTGRFLSADPVAPRLNDTLSLNPYLYARNNPVRYIDPMGTQEDSTTSWWQQLRGRFDQWRGRTVAPQELPVDSPRTRHTRILVRPPQPAAPGTELLREAPTRPRVELPSRPSDVVPAIRTPAVPTPNVPTVDRGAITVSMDRPAPPSGAVAVVPRLDDVPIPAARPGGVFRITREGLVIELSNLADTRLGRFVRGTGGAVRRGLRWMWDRLPYVGLFFAASSVASAAEHEQAHVLAREAGSEVGGLAAGYLTLVVIPEPNSSVVGMVGLATLWLGGPMVGEQLAGRLVPPGQRPEMTRRPLRDDEFIPQPTAAEDLTHEDAQKVLGPAQRTSDQEGIELFRDRAEALTEQLEDAQNSKLADYRRRAGNIDRQLTEQERRLAEQIEAYNRWVAQENARRAAALQAWQAQQLQQSLGTLNEQMKRYWDGRSLSPPPRSPDLSASPGLRYDPFHDPRFQPKR